MDAQEIANRIALLWNPMPVMGGQQIERLHGRQRRLVEDLAAEIASETERFREALVVIAGGDGDPAVIAQQTLDGTEND